MTPKEKIFSVLKEIKEKSEILPKNSWVEFRFDDNFGADILVGEEERNILLKLQEDAAIELRIPEEIEEGSVYTPEELMFKGGRIWIELQPGFDLVYRRYKSKSKRFNFWNLVNPFWLVWKLIYSFFRLLKVLIKKVWEHKLLSAVSSAMAFIALDFALAFNNILKIYNWLRLWISKFFS